MIAELAALGIAVLLLLGGKKKTTTVSMSGAGPEFEEMAWADGPYTQYDEALEAARQYAANSGRATEAVFAEERDDGGWDAVVWFL